MITVKKYRGHIRNWKALCTELGIGENLSKEEREEQILVKAYETWKEDMASHIYGMFAFALWNYESNELFCLRDQFGTKPFYYYITEDGNILYGTYIREIMEQEGFRKELNEDMLQIYLTLSYDGGEDTFFKGVKKLMPGRYLKWTKEDGVKITRYWKPEFKPDNSLSLDDYANKINETMEQIMPEVLDENERAESFLSGGVDSSYVFAISTAQNADAIGYEEKNLDESLLAAETAKLLGKTINRRIVKPEEYFEIVPWVMENMELPLGDASAIVFALGCKAAKEHCDICYSGEGSDEFFGGYNVYKNADIYGKTLKNNYVGNTNLMKEDEKKKILKSYNPEVLPINLVKEIYDEAEGYEYLSQMTNVDIQLWLEGDIYLNVDKMSTAAGLEVRMPLTDMRIFEIASKMPAKYKVQPKEKTEALVNVASKYLHKITGAGKKTALNADPNPDLNKLAFRKAASKYIPENIAYRKKLGFVVPIRYWMADDNYNKDIREKLAGPSAEKFFRTDELKKIWDEYKGGNSDLWRKIWVIYTFLVWYDIYFAE